MPAVLLSVGAGAIYANNAERNVAAALRIADAVNDILARYDNFGLEPTTALEFIRDLFDEFPSNA